MSSENATMTIAGPIERWLCFTFSGTTNEPRFRGTTVGQRSFDVASIYVSRKLFFSVTQRSWNIFSSATYLVISNFIVSDLIHWYKWTMYCPRSDILSTYGRGLRWSNAMIRDSPWTFPPLFFFLLHATVCSYEDPCPLREFEGKHSWANSR